MKAIVTGATKGIGRAIAIALAKQGYDVAINARNAQDLMAFQQELQQLNGDINVISIPTDMSIKEEVFAFADFVGDKWPEIDVLVNNAGVFLGGKIMEEDDGALEKMIETNLYSAYYLSRSIVPSMLKNGKGHIFNICSIASFMAYPNGGSYSISKFAMLGMSKVLRAELMNENIKVTSIMPGAVWSNSWAGVELPRERLMEPEDIAESVLSALKMGPSAVVEDIVIRPQLGDL